ncbi:MAG TPA: patatin-like phospholipase family protein [Phnomibacter sp.]|nr:patatin-like phospholipase family protein [Phnomibacter sp.]
MYRMLAIDGGGSRGIIPATVLDCLSQDTGKQPAQLFDLLAGTSTGGIIAIALAAGISTAQLVDVYLNKSEIIFKETFFDRLSGLDEHLKANYQHKNLKKILDELLGSKTLGTVHLDAQFGKAGKHLMVCSFDLYPEKQDPEGREKNYRPAVYHSGFIRDKEVLLADLALRTASGPTYFPIYQNHIDGGVAMNNPSMAAVAFALNDHISDKGNYLYPDGKNKGLDRKKTELRLLSLGCGTSNQTFITEAEIKRRNNGNWGNIQWIKYLPDLLTEGNMQSTWYYVQQVLSSNQYFRLHPLFNEATNYPVLQKNILGLAVTDKKLLQAMHLYAKDLYVANKTEIWKMAGV